MHTKTRTLTCMPIRSHARHTFTCSLYTHVHTHICMHTCLHTHTHTLLPTTSSWPSGSHPSPSCAEEETVGDQAQSWGCWSGRIRGPSGTQPSGSAELQGLLKVEDSQRRPAASPPGPPAPFLKAELPSPRCPSRSSCTPRAPRRPLSSAGLTALREGPPCGGDAAKGGLEQGAPRSC